MHFRALPCVSVRFRAREITHPEVGRDLLDRFTGMLEDVATIDRPPAMEGRQMSIVLEPRKGEPKPDDADSSDGAAADAGTTPETQPVTGSS